MNHKKIRAKKIIETIGNSPIIIFSCGNASKEIQQLSNNAITISPNGDFTPNKRFSFQDIYKLFPNHFDATSGNLPMNLLYTIAQEYKKALGDISFNNIIIPCGSGELALALSLIIPIDKITIYGVFEGNNAMHPTLSPILIEKNNHLYNFLYNNFKKIELNQAVSYRDNIEEIKKTLLDNDLLIDTSHNDAREKQQSYNS